MKKIFTTSVLIWVWSCIALAQSSTCPWVNAGPDISLPCGQNCTTLSASYLHTRTSETYRLDSIPYNPVTFTGGTAVLGAGVDDEWSNLIPLPFKFCFFGVSYYQLSIGSNGIITFDSTVIPNSPGACTWSLTSYTTGIPNPLMTSTPKNSIMGPYQDIDPAFGGVITYQTIGTAPYRIFVVNYYNDAYYSCRRSDTATSQILLYEGTNIIDININVKQLCPGWNNGLAIEGIQNADATLAYAVPGRNLTQWTANNDAWRFTPDSSSNVVLSWYQGSTFIGNGDSINVCPPNNSTTEYIAQASYSGCDSSVTIISDTLLIHILQSAGPTQYLSCPTVIDSVVMAAAGTGTWSALSTNPAATTITNLTSPHTSIKGFPAVSGIYRYVWASSLCRDTVSVIVTLRPNAGPDVATCVNGIAIMAALGNGTWSSLPTNPAPTSITSPTSSHTTITGFSVGGSYGFVWTVGNCTDTAFVTVPTFTSSAHTSDSSLCKYQTTTLSATASPSILGPYSYQWGPGSAVIAPHSATTATSPLLGNTLYQVTVTSAGGCVLIDTVLVSLTGSAPRIQIIPSSNSVCPGDTVYLNANVAVESLVPCGPVDTCVNFALNIVGPTNPDTNSNSFGSGAFGSNANGMPFAASNNAYKVQYLFRASELNAMGLSSGTMTGLDFFVKAINSTSPYDSFRVSIGCTSLDSLSDFVSSGSLTEVFYQPALFTPNQGWTNISFSPLYGWDGISNLIVQVCYTLTGTSSSDDGVSFVTPGFSGASVWAGSWFLTDDGCGYSSVNAGFLSGVENTRPLTKFEMCIPNVLTYQWTPIGTLYGDTMPSTAAVVNGKQTYHLTVNDNGCIGSDSITLNTNPYLHISTGPGVTLCSTNDTAHLHVSIDSFPTPTCELSYQLSSVPYNSIAGTQTIIPTTAYFDAFSFNSPDDGTAGPFPLPFHLQFYCQTFDSFWVNANGWISFVNPYPATGSGSYAQYFPPSIFDVDPMKEIAFLVGDYLVTNTGNIGYFTSGSGSGASLVIQYNNLTSYFGSYSSSGQIQIHADGTIDIMIQSSNYSSAPHTTGIKDSTGIGIAPPSRDLQYYTISTPEGWHFEPQSGRSVVERGVTWSPNIALRNNTVDSPYAYPSTSQTYYVQTDILIHRFESDSEVCHIRDSVRVNVTTFRDSVGLTPSILCPFDTAQLSFNTANTVQSILWTSVDHILNPTSAHTGVIGVDTATIYVTATDINGCHVSDTIVLRTYPVLHPLISSAVSANPSLVCYSDSIRIGLSAASTYSNLVWHYADSTGHVDSIVPGSNDSASIFGHPHHYYVLTVSAPGTVCPNTSNLIEIDSFIRQPISIASSGSDTFCQGGSVTLAVTSGLSIYQWTPGYISGTSYVADSSGTFSYTARDAHGCLLYSPAINILVNPIPTITIASFRSPICINDTAHISATVSLPGVGLEWLLGGSIVSTGSTVSATAAGTYVAQTTTGCQATATAVLATVAPPQVSFGPDVTMCSCQPDTSVTPIVSPSSGSDGFLWSDGITTQTHAITSVGNTTYFVTVTDTNSCHTTASINVNINCLRVLAAASPDSVVTGSILTLTDTLGPQSITYQWWPVDTSMYTPTQYHTPYRGGTIGADTFYLYAEDTHHCRDTSSVVVYVLALGGTTNPSAFTPNGDGHNDLFIPTIGTSSSVITFRVYNRWGQVVHDDPTKGWDGTYGGSPQPADTYIYFMTIESPDRNDAAKKIQRSVQGSFQLFR